MRTFSCTQALPLRNNEEVRWLIIRHSEFDANESPVDLVVKQCLPIRASWLAYLSSSASLKLDPLISQPLALKAVV